MSTEYDHLLRMIATVVSVLIISAAAVVVYLYFSGKLNIGGSSGDGGSGDGGSCPKFEVLKLYVVNSTKTVDRIADNEIYVTNLDATVNVSGVADYYMTKTFYHNHVKYSPTLERDLTETKTGFVLRYMGRTLLNFDQYPAKPLDSAIVNLSHESLAPGLTTYDPTIRIYIACSNPMTITTGDDYTLYTMVWT